MRKTDIEFEKNQLKLSWKLIDRLYKLQSNQINRISITSHMIYVEDKKEKEEQFFLSDLKKLNLNTRLSFHPKIFCAIACYKF